ncbi:MAG: tetratricopeptide repeat protein, partial [Myxococcota bacterium]|nr:tetratricopeptide repeat protein [Myxococcota bacterium]
LAEAQVVSTRVLEQDVCDDKAWANLGTSLFRQQQSTAALAAFWKAVELDPHSPAYGGSLGEVLWTLGREDEARARLEWAAQWGPDIWQPRAVLGGRALKAGQLSEAERWLQEAVALAPERGNLRALLGLAQLGLGKLENAERVFSGLDQGTKDSVVGRALGEALTRVKSTRPSTVREQETSP